jgi:hypothetical protein
MTDDLRYKAALDRLFVEPEAVTDSDIELMSKIDDALAHMAAVRRADTLRRCAETRHRAATGQPPVKRNAAEEYAEMISVTVIAALAQPRQRIRSLEASKAELERRIRSLESRILELEARDAARTVTHADH